MVNKGINIILKHMCLINHMLAQERSMRLIDNMRLITRVYGIGLDWSNHKNADCTHTEQ